VGAGSGDWWVEGGEREQSTGGEEGGETRGDLRDSEQEKEEESGQEKEKKGEKEEKEVGKKLEEVESEGGKEIGRVKEGAEVVSKKLLIGEGMRVKIEEIGDEHGARGQEMGKKKMLEKRKVKGEVKERQKRQKGNVGRGSERDNQEEKEEDEDTVEKKKEGSQSGIRRERKSARKAIAAALDRIGTTAQSIQRSKTELAIEKLQDEYRLIVSVEKLVKAFWLMENEVKASVFIALQDRNARDRWLAECLDQM